MNNKLSQNDLLLLFAIEVFDKKALEVIQMMAESFDLDLNSRNPFSPLLAKKNNKRSGSMMGGWLYRFHGGSCEFKNQTTGQFLDLSIIKEKQYSAIDLFFLKKFIETTESLKEVALAFNQFRSIHESIIRLTAANQLRKINHSFEPHSSILVLNENRSIKNPVGKPGVQN